MIRRLAKLLTWYTDPVQFFRDITGWEPNKGQRELLEILKGKQKRVLVCAASGTGKTLSLGVLALWYALILPYVERKPKSVLIISGSLEQSKTLYDYSSRFLRSCSEINDLIEDRLRTETRFKNGSTLRAIPCSEKAYYGKHVDLLIIDEAALKDLPTTLIDHALSIVAPVKDARLIMSSTPYDANSKFVELWEATEDYPQWTRIHWTARDCPWINQESILEAQKTLSQAEFQVRWEGQVAPIADRIFEKKLLKACLTAERPRQGNGPICFGIDWGFDHPTVIIIVQQITESNWQVLETREFRKARAQTIEDAIIRLNEKYKPVAIYTDSSHIFENNRLIELNLPIVPIVFKREKDRMLSNLIRLIEQNNLAIYEQEIHLIRQLRDYTRDARHNDDYVDALMLAVRESEASAKIDDFFRVVKYK